MSEKIKCGIDLDDVLFSTTNSIFVRLKEQFPDKDVQECLVTRWDVAECLGLPEDIVRKTIYDTIKASYFSAKLGSLQTLNYYKDTFEYYFITARNATLTEHTHLNLQIVLEDLYKKENIYLVDEKHKIIKALGLSVFIDDRAKTIEDIYKHTDCLPVVYSKPWNQRLKQKFRRVTDWSDIFQTLHYIKEESSEWRVF